MPPTVIAAAKALIQHNGRFLIVKQRVGDKVFWDLPGGRVRHGESPYETVVREVREEVGLDVEVIGCAGAWWFLRSTDNNEVVCTTFFCNPKNPDAVQLQTDDDEEVLDEFRWVKKEDFLTDSFAVSHQSLKDLIGQII